MTKMTDDVDEERKGGKGEKPCSDGVGKGSCRCISTLTIVAAVII